METATIEIILTMIRFAYDILKDVRAQGQSNLQGQRSAALNALYQAATETAEYIECLQKEGVQKPDTEARLSQLWRNAANKLYQFNHEFADRLFLKADYWQKPTEWSEGDIKKARIGLSDIRREIMVMMQNE